MFLQCKNNLYTWFTYLGDENFFEKLPNKLKVDKLTSNITRIGGKAKVKKLSVTNKSKLSVLFS